MKQIIQCPGSYIWNGNFKSSHRYQKRSVNICKIIFFYAKFPKDSKYAPLGRDWENHLATRRSFSTIMASRQRDIRKEKKSRGKKQEQWWKNAPRKQRGIFICEFYSSTIEKAPTNLPIEIWEYLRMSSCVFPILDFFIGLLIDVIRTLNHQMFWIF